MGKKVFISFNFNDRNFRNDLANLFQANGGPIQATPTFVVNNVSRDGEAAIKAEIDRVMQGCSGMIVVLGEGAHNSPWMIHESGLAASKRLKTVSVRHPQAKGGPPNSHAGMPILDWSPAEIARVVASWP